MSGSSSWDKGHHAHRWGDNAEEGRQRQMYLEDPYALYLSHAALQLERGEGKDLITLQEPRRKANTLARWPDLLSFDIAYWSDQQSQIFQLGRETCSPPIQQHTPGSKPIIPGGYINELRGEWIRLFYNGRLVYGNLYSALHYIINWAQVAVETWLNRRFPFQLQRDSQLLPHSAAGHQAYHKENFYNDQLVKTYLANHYHDWLNEHLFDFTFELNQYLDQQTPATYVIEYKNAKGLPCIDFVCKNQHAMRLVRPAHFVEDIQNMICDSRYLEHKAQELAARIENEIRALGW
ncbi:hypothetical protein [Photobacterium rosenbergii]|uniref:hypothetical protein n=1 Tax=Photobacterium rosenbergii TaxID=294936 RepID=UPI001C995F52|nr:hypothetical protein [Photobacterium rosenbergii]MBY5944388.1 hypothetical protein [Photobacterium rosenbergii]